MALPPPKVGLDLRRCVWRLACDVKKERLDQFADLQNQIYSFSRATPLEYLAMMQLWKGLYYLLWKEDSEELQRSLAQKIAGLLYLFPGPEEERGGGGGGRGESGDGGEGGSESRSGRGDESESEDGAEGKSGSGGEGAPSKARRARPAPSQGEKHNPDPASDESDDSKSDDSDSDANESGSSESGGSSASAATGASEGAEDAEPSSPSSSPSEELADYGGQTTLFLRCGLETLCREWTNIDYLRIDKYLYLVRCLARALCLQILQCPEDSEEPDNLMSTFVMVLLSEGRISSMLSPATLVMQFADVWCDCVRWAMRRAVRDRSAPRSPETGGMTGDVFCFLFLPWLEFVATTPNAGLAAHVAESVFEDMTDYTYEPPYNFGDYIGSGEVPEGLGGGDEAGPAAEPGERRRPGPLARSASESASESESNPASNPAGVPETGSAPSPLADLDFLSLALVFAANEDSRNREALQAIAEDLDAYQRWWAEDGRPAFLEESSSEEGPRPARREPRKADIEARELRDRVNAMIYRQAGEDFENLERDEDGVLEYHPRLQRRRARDLLYHYGIRKTALQEGREKYDRLYGETPEQRREREARLAAEARRELAEIEARARPAPGGGGGRSKARRRLLSSAGEGVAAAIPATDFGGGSDGESEGSGEGARGARGRGKGRGEKRAGAPPGGRGGGARPKRGAPRKSRGPRNARGRGRAGGAGRGRKG